MQLSLRSKILLLTSCIVVAVVGMLSLAIRSILQERILAELHKRGDFIASSVARQSLTPLLTGDMLGLRLTLSEIKRNDADVVYIFVQDRDGTVPAHTFPEGFPEDLRGLPGPEADGPPGTRILETEEGRVIDISSPIHRGAGGEVHVGMTEAPVRHGLALINRAVFNALLLVLVLVGVTVIVMAVRVINPLEELAGAAEKVGAGDLGQRVRVRSRDEIGRLGETFNRMAADLEVQREERLRAEQSLIEAKADLEKRNLELQKLDRLKDGLIRDVSHELKTPVAKHTMQVELLRKYLEPGGEPPAVRRLLDTMEVNIRRQEHVIGTILDLSRLEAGKGKGLRLETVQLDQLLSQVVEEHRIMLDSYGITVETSLHEVALRTDGSMLWHVFSNLLTNAIKFRRIEAGPSISISLARRDGGAEIRFMDNGIGMTGEELSRAFERFYRGATTSEGAGVGLSICRMIVKELGGSISLESEGRGRGTTVTVLLPDAQAA